jgi:hypothetical protein
LLMDAPGIPAQVLSGAFGGHPADGGTLALTATCRWRI